MAWLKDRPGIPSCAWLRVHLIYDVGGKMVSAVEISKILEGTSGIYKDVDVERESKKLRGDWERNVHS